MSQTVTITTSNVPAGFCFTTWQQSWTELVSLLSGTLPGDATLFVMGNTTPDASDRDKPWYRLNADGSPDRWYKYWNGVWCCQIIPYDINERRIHVGTPAQIWSYDGGSGDDPSVVSPTITTGATWYVDTEFEAKFPVGVGTFAASGAVTVKGSTTSTAVTGVDQHTLTVAELPAHTHDTPIPRDSASDTFNSTSIEGDQATTSPWTSEETGGDQAHNNLPPFYGVYFIRRTIRQYYTV